MVTFRAYVVERVCLNLRPDLGPRFWKDRKYWQPKFVRESVALSRLLEHFDENDPVVRRAVIDVARDVPITVGRRTHRRSCPPSGSALEACLVQFRGVEEPINSRCIPV